MAALVWGRPRRQPWESWNFLELFRTSSSQSSASERDEREKLKRYPPGLSSTLTTIMFGLIISGRPVDATPQTITEAQYAFRIPPEPHFSHIVVFILPGTQLPPDTAATVYVQIPGQEFKLLGGIGIGKESAIFKLSGMRSGSAAGGDEDAMTDTDPASAPTGVPAGGDIVVGISIEPAAQVEQQLVNLKSSQSQPTQSSTALVSARSGNGANVSTKVLAQRIIGNAFNFLASFGSDTVPLKAFQDWWVKFEKKVELDPSFLEREQG